MRYLFLVIALINTLSVFSQPRELTFDRLSIEDGMPENNVVSFLQDNIGYMWIGTQNGLVRYDGYELKVYSQLDGDSSKSTAGIIVTALFEDKNGNLWVAAYMHGLYRYNRSSNDFTKLSREDRGGIVQIAEDADGMIWTLTYRNVEVGSHVDVFDPRKGLITTYDSVITGSRHLPTARLNKLFSTSDKQIVIGTDNGLYLFGKDTVRSFFTGVKGKSHIISDIYEAPSEPGVLWMPCKTLKKSGLVRIDIARDSTKWMQSSDNNFPGTDTVFTMFEDRSKNFWMGTASGLALLDRKKEVFKKFVPADNQAQSNANWFYKIAEDNHGILWILSMKGLLYFKPDTREFVRHIGLKSDPDAMVSYDLSSLLFDKNENLWISTSGHGLYRFNEQRSEYLFVHKDNDQRNYPGGAITGIKRLKNSKLLVGTEEGTYLTDSALTLFTKIDATFSKGNISCIDIDEQGIAWIGTFSDGLFRYKPGAKAFKQFLNDPKDSTSLSNNDIFTVYADGENIWIGTLRGGLCKFNTTTEKFTRLPFIVNENSIPLHGELDDDDVLSIYRDRKKILWVGTNNGGLNKYNENTRSFTSFNKFPEFSCITAIYDDKEGRMWAGTYLSGLVLFDRETTTYKSFTEKHGLLYNNVVGIDEDDSGRIWISSARGFSILDKNDSISSLNSIQGLPTSNITWRKAVHLANGDWIQPTFHGLIVFNPNKISQNKTPPVVVLEKLNITGLGADGKGLQTIYLHGLKDLKLSHNENRLNFDFVALHYSNSKMNKYRYKLDEFDPGWIEAGNQRTASYTNLLPGRYTFNVLASNSDGIWAALPATVSFTIRPPWWHTWWAYTLYALAAIAITYSYVSYRSKVLRRQNKMLEEKVSLRTGQLQKSIENLKATQTQLIESEKMASLGELTAGIAHEIQNPLNFINNFAEVSAELTDELDADIDAGNIANAKLLSGDLKQNMHKIVHHGKRADSIVKNMLHHSRLKPGEKEAIDLNALVDEYLRLSYHGLRAKDKSFNAAMQTELSPAVGTVKVVQQDISRVLLNLFSNAFYSVAQKKKQFNGTYEPMVHVSTVKDENFVRIVVRDNGFGIPKNIVDKIYQPFFTTKPTGEGTGLGLSMSYDIITKGHGGKMAVNTVEQEYAEFVITLPC